mmetsp:Transcript_39862/g.124994  ORF Transcript_39862/g.124994 Transcript_39862/m.124994 type:complete len:319 (+) Transcript_39862:227-1183(+)
MPPPCRRCSLRHQSGLLSRGRFRRLHRTTTPTRSRAPAVAIPRPPPPQPPCSTRTDSPAGLARLRCRPRGGLRLSARAAARRSEAACRRPSLPSLHSSPASAAHTRSTRTRTRAAAAQAGLAAEAPAPSTSLSSCLWAASRRWTELPGTRPPRCGASRTRRLPPRGGPPSAGGREDDSRHETRRRRRRRRGVVSQRVKSVRHLMDPLFTVDSITAAIVIVLRYRLKTRAGHTPLARPPGGRLVFRHRPQLSSRHMCRAAPPSRLVPARRHRLAPLARCDAQHHRAAQLGDGAQRLKGAAQMAAQGDVEVVGMRRLEPA